MRKTITTYLLALICLGLNAQRVQSLEEAPLGELFSKKDSKPIVQGILAGYTPDLYPELTVRYKIATLSFRRQVSKTAQISHSGQFFLEFDHAIPYQEVWISIGDLYQGKILAATNLKLILDLNVLSEFPVEYVGEGITLEGNDAALNVFINEFERYKVDKKQDLLHEKLAILMSSELNKTEKVKEIKKLYKRQAGIENSFAKRNGKEFEWILTNDRIATMYADIFSVHWGKRMSELLKQECVSFTPKILSNASVQYYDFLCFYLTKPNKIETKLITERTLRDQLNKSTSSAKLDQFLREFNKKNDNLRFNSEIYLVGEQQYLDRYEKELKDAKLDMQLRKINGLNKEKATIVKLLGQPKCLADREHYIKKLASNGNQKWAINEMRKDLMKDRAFISELNILLNTASIASDLSLGNATEVENQFLSNAESIEDLFAAIRAHFKDKAIVIDLWAPWSAHCLKDLHANSDLLNAVDTLPVQFVYLCSGRDVSHEEWKIEINNIKVPGTHIYLEPVLSAEIIEYFQVRTFPSYFFIDQEGRFDPDFIDDLANLRPKNLISRLELSSKL